MNEIKNKRYLIIFKHTKNHFCLVIIKHFKIYIRFQQLK